MRGLLPAALLGFLFFVGAPFAQKTADAPRLTGPTPFTKETPAPPMQRRSPTMCGGGAIIRISRRSYHMRSRATPPI